MRTNKLLTAILAVATLTLTFGVAGADAQGRRGPGGPGGQSGGGARGGGPAGPQGGPAVVRPGGPATGGVVAGGHVVVAPGGYPYRGYPYYGYGYGYRYGYGYPYYGAGFSVGFSYGYPYGYWGVGYGYPAYAYGYPYYPYAPAPGYVAVSPSASYGGLRIQGAPREAQVFVDGYYVGAVDDLDGALQQANLTPGPHKVEIRVPGSPSTQFDVNIQPGETVTYHADRR